MNPIIEIEARPFQFGGAVRLLWVSPSDATFDHVLILRKATASFTGPTDPGATIVHRGVGKQAMEFRSVFLPDDIAASNLYRTVLDDGNDSWNAASYYAIYAMNASESDVSAAAIVSATMPPVSVVEELDLIGILMPFLSSYLKEQIRVGILPVQQGITDVTVFDGPPLLDAVKFPIVSLHLDDDHPIAFAIGDDIGYMDEAGDTVRPRRGFMSSVTIAIVGVTDNPEVRRYLYRSLKAALIAARQLLEQKGLLNMEVTGRYAEDFEHYDMALYSAELTLRGAVASSVSVPAQDNLIGTINTNQGVLTPVPIDP